ncbi:MAG: hypothetical protein CML94_04535 [Rhodobiaceae bacterium]|nr:hypothetical protein [Rhodobiaceae bacterium]|tara:strand:+ start:265 stop:720 length:456 start_codon:yes stop_codon:yes gene_type:complete
MSQNRDIAEKFYTSITNGEIQVIEDLLIDDFELIVPMENGILSGHYKGKKRFMEDILPLVFSCVNPEDIVFCKNFKIINSFNNIIISMAQNDGIALSGKSYNQIYLHIMTIEDRKIIRLIESFDSALANDSLWGDSKKLIPDKLFSLKNFS